MDKYDHQSIESKWQRQWEQDKLYQTGEGKDKPKCYVLDMFPYPSGVGLHVGHPKGYIATDVFSRLKMLQGYNVLHPMGWDAFGLPAENYAIENKIHPRQAVEHNIQVFKKQLEKLGFTYDWNREINTTDPEYYKWTQWVFLQMFKKGLAYESYEPINWCPSCKTGLANEDLENGKCERCGSEIERKPMRQWVLKITDYAERLLNDIDKLEHWEDSIKEMQRNWIGRSEGAMVDFTVASLDYVLRVFTTRPDTLFGATFMVVAPEHELIEKFKGQISNVKEVEAYIKQAKAKSDLERTDLAKEKTGVELKGLKAINPVNNKEIPIFMADYVLAGYGTGAIMAVPAHDERDWEFANKFNIPIIEVVDGSTSLTTGGGKEGKFFIGEGIAVNSEHFNGLPTAEVKEKITTWLEEKKIGHSAINYKLRDWVFSRQRYWGEPIPIIHCEKCGAVAVLEKDLPVTLPEVENYEPTGTGESPLAVIDDWVNTTCPECGGPAKRETNTMPQWAGSSWYYLRYIDPQNKETLVDKAKEKYWSPVDLYVGGAEHATRHLIYARFWHKFLYDIGAVNYEEPFTRLQHVGLIMAEDGRKMSKRWNNVINPDDVIEQYGADSMRVYEMFMGPFNQSCAWSTNGLKGARGFLDKVEQLKIKNEKLKIEDNIIHKTIKKVGDDIENFRFNTAISAMMILVNELSAGVSQENYEKFLIILSPFAPHLAEELWFRLGNKESIFKQSWPEFNSELAQDDEFELVIQINGKVRDKLTVKVGITQVEVEELVKNSNKVKKYLDGKKPKKVIYVLNKLVNIVV